MGTADTMPRLEQLTGVLVDYFRTVILIERTFLYGKRDATYLWAGCNDMERLSYV